MSVSRRGGGRRGGGGTEGVGGGGAMLFVTESLSRLRGIFFYCFFFFSLSKQQGVKTHALRSKASGVKRREEEKDELLAPRWVGRYRRGEEKATPEEVV